MEKTLAINHYINLKYEIDILNKSIKAYKVLGKTISEKKALKQKEKIENLLLEIEIILENLTGIDYKVFYLRKIEGLSQEEVAEKENVSVRTVQRSESRLRYRHYHQMITLTKLNTKKVGVE